MYAEGTVLGHTQCAQMIFISRSNVTVNQSEFPAQTLYPDALALSDKDPHRFDNRLGDPEAYSRWVLSPGNYIA